METVKIGKKRSDGAALLETVGFFLKGRDVNGECISSDSGEDYPSPSLNSQINFG